MPGFLFRERPPTPPPRMNEKMRDALLAVATSANPSGADRLILKFLKKDRGAPSLDMRSVNGERTAAAHALREYAMRLLATEMDDGDGAREADPGVC